MGENRLLWFFQSLKEPQANQFWSSRLRPSSCSGRSTTPSLN